MAKKLRNRRSVRWTGLFAVWAVRSLWRYRAGLTPWWLGLGLLVVGWVAGTWWPGWWPLPWALALVTAAMVWFRGAQLSGPLQQLWLALVPSSLDDGEPGVLDRPTERGYLALLVLGCGSWLAARMQHGWTDTVQACLLGGVLVLGAPWWWHRGWRRRRPLSIWARRWNRVNTNDDLKVWHGSKVVRVTGNRKAITLTVQLRSGLTVKKVAGDAIALCSALGLRPGAVTVSIDKRAARRVTVRVVPRDPWGGALPHPVPALRSRDLDVDRKVLVGRYEDGTDSRVKLEQHALVVGATGSGKSEWVQSYIAWILSYRHTAVVAADLASGATFDVWEDCLSAPLAVDVPSAFGLLRGVFRLIEHRERQLAKLRRSGQEINVLPVTADTPAVFVFVDEFPDLVNGAKMSGQDGGEKIDVMTVLERIAKKARKVRIWLILAAQNPGVTDVGSTTLRAQLTATVGLGLDDTQSKTLWGSLRSQGWDSEPLTVGTYLLRDRNDKDHQEPRVAKGLLLSPEQRSQLIRAASAQTGTLSAVELAILSGADQPAPLGGSAPRLRVVPATPAVPSLASAAGPARAARSAELDELVFAECPDPHQGGIGGTEVAAQLGVTRDRVKRAFQRLEQAGRVAPRGDGTWART
jgi:hypothetical protein